MTLILALPHAHADHPNLDSWKASSPRDEIRPAFESSNEGGYNGKGLLSITADAREGLMGHWRKTVAVEGGQHYQFSVWRRTDGIDLVRRAAMARVIWLDRDGQRPLRDEVSVSRLPAEKPRSEPELPVDGETDGDWTRLVGKMLRPTPFRRPARE